MQGHEPNGSPLRIGSGSAAYAEMLSRALPQEAPSPAGKRLASFFCGCGGVDLGFRSAGFELAFASDYNPRVAESFARNLGHTPIVSDIREVRGSEVPDVTVLTGGFPLCELLDGRASARRRGHA